MLELGSLPIERYEYTADPANRKRLGPTAAAFNTAFGVGAGADLAPADVAGVALAAAKQLTARVASLEGPAGPRRGPRATPAPPRRGGTAPSTAFDDAVAKLGGLERSDRRLRKRNRKLRDRVAQARAAAAHAAAGRVIGVRRIICAATGALAGRGAGGCAGRRRPGLRR